jgi:integrase
MTSGLSAATTRKAVFALRQCLAAAIAGNRLQFNSATAIPLPTERQKPARYLSQLEVERLVDEIPRQYRALVLVGAYAGLRRGEAAGLRRRNIDPLRSRIHVVHTAVEVRGRVTLNNEPKTTRSKRSVPVARSIMRRLEEHLLGLGDGLDVALFGGEVPTTIMKGLAVSARLSASDRSWRTSPAVTSSQPPGMR